MKMIITVQGPVLSPEVLQIEYIISPMILHSLKQTGVCLIDTIETIPQIFCLHQMLVIYSITIDGLPYQKLF